MQFALLYSVFLEVQKNKINDVFFNQMVFVNSLLLIQYRVFINSTFLEEITRGMNYCLCIWHDREALLIHVLETSSI